MAGEECQYDRDGESLALAVLFLTIFCFGWGFADGGLTTVDDTCESVVVTTRRCFSSVATDECCTVQLLIGGAVCTAAAAAGGCPLTPNTSVNSRAIAIVFGGGRTAVAGDGSTKGSCVYFLVGWHRDDRIRR